MPELLIELEQNDAIYASVIDGGEVAFASQTPVGPTGCAWIGTFGFSVYLTNYNGSILNSSYLYESDGLGLDSNDCFWSAGANAGSVYKTDYSFNYLDSFSFPGTSVYGLDVDSYDSIWTGDSVADASLYHFDQTGSLVETIYFPQPDGPIGVGIDSNDSLWLADSYQPDEIRHMNRSGSVIDSFAFPENGLEDIAVDSQRDDSIWVNNSGTTCTYEIDRDGSIINAFSWTELAQRGIEIVPP